MIERATQRTRAIATVIAGARIGIVGLLVLGVGCGKNASNIDRLGSSDPIVRETAAWTLGRAEDRSAVKALIHVVETDSNDRVRSAAIAALGDIGDQRATPALTALAASSEPRRLRAEALNSLRKLRDPASVAPLIAIWKLDANQNDNNSIHAVVQFVLLQIPEVSYDPLIAALHDDHPNVRTMAAWTLGEIGDKSAASAIWPLLDDPDLRVRAFAKDAVKRLEAPR